MSNDKHESGAGVSVVIPALNEAQTIVPLVEAVRAHFPAAEVIVVDDGSTDDTGPRSEAAGARVVRHPYRKGNGAAVKSGARAATGETIVLLDADGQHAAEDIERLLERIAAGYDMAVGARDGSGQANVVRHFGNSVYNRLASWIVGQPIRDLTSGFRAARTELFREFLPLFPNGFSYTTTVTMAFFRTGYSVAYVPIDAAPRTGRSHLRVVRDGIRFALIIFRVGTLYSPLKLFFPISTGCAAIGLLHYLNTYLADGRFTNMSALLLVTSMLIFLIGLVSEQIVMLLYKRD